MTIEILKEAGLEEALEGLSYSYNNTKSFEELKELSNYLASKDFGHNKFLESIMIWIRVSAPRYWWAEADTYRMSTKQSQSTMHTLTKRELIKEDFESDVIWDNADEMLSYYNKLIKLNDWHTLKGVLPESFLQRRMWVMSYKTLRNIIQQRINHELPEWRKFCAYIIGNCSYPEYLCEGL